MSRTRKRKPREFYSGTKHFMPCLRHGYCWYCDSDREHNKRKTEADSKADLRAHQDE